MGKKTKARKAGGTRGEREEKREEEGGESLEVSLFLAPFLLLPLPNPSQRPLFASALTAGPKVASTAPFQVAAASEASVGGRRGSGSYLELSRSRRG